MTWLAMTSALAGVALSRWCRVLVLVPLAFFMILVCVGAAIGGLLTVTTATLCALIEMMAMQVGFLAGAVIQNRSRIRKKKRLATV